MDLRHLRYFIAVAEDGGFTAAADRLQVAQSALSRQIRDLETFLGVQLFERHARGAALTTAGEMFLGDARRVIEDARLARERARRAAEGEAHVLHISFSSAAMRYRHVADHFQRFRAQYPDIELRLTQADTETQLDALRAGRIDIGFLTNHPMQNEFDLNFHSVVVDRYGVILPTTHPLARQREKIRLRELGEERFIFFPRAINSYMHDAVFEAFRREGIHPRIIAEAQSEPTILNMVAAGMGISLLGMASVERWSDDVIFKEVVGLNLSFRLDMVWRKANSSPLLANFTGLLEDGAAETTSRTSRRRARGQ